MSFSLCIKEKQDGDCSNCNLHKQCEEYNDAMRNKEEIVYVIGIPQGGGCWLSNGTAYSTRKQAEEKLQEDRIQNITYTRIFELHVDGLSTLYG